MNIIYDIETKPRSSVLEAMLSTEPKFDPDSVAIGNLKDQEKIKTKIINEGIKHETKMVEWREKQRKTCALDPDYGQLSAIGILHVESGKYEIIDGKDEAKALEEFWALADHTITRGELMLGWNTEGFDLPFLFGRSRLIGVEYNWTYITNYRYFNPSFVDLQKVWTFGQFGKYCKLRKASDALGFKVPEMEVEGATFHKFWEGTEEEREKAKQYLYCDLDQTMAVAKATHGLGVKKEYTEEDCFSG